MGLSIFSRAGLVRRQVADFLHGQAADKLPHALVGVGDALARALIGQGA